MKPGLDQKLYSAAAQWTALAALTLALLASITAAKPPAEKPDVLPAAWSNWKYFRSIDLSATQDQRLVSLRVPLAVFAHSQNQLADVRVIDDRGQQVPYVLHVTYGSTKTQSRAARQLELSYVPGKYTQVVLDAGAQAPFHNSVHVSTPLGDFIAWADVNISDDARTWRHIGGIQPIYRFSRKNIDGDQTLVYPETNARYIRLRIYDKQKQFPMVKTDIRFTVTVPEESQPADAVFEAVPSRDSQKSVWRADLGYSLPIDSVRIDSSDADFYRSVEVFASDDAENWYLRGSGQIYHFQAGAPPAPFVSVGDQMKKTYLHTGFGFSENFARYWRVEVENGSDPPLANAKVQLYMAARNVVFRQLPGRTYRLLYGQSEAKEPQYDLAQTAGPEQIRDASLASGVGAERINMSWTDPRPWTDRNSMVLWIAAILAALLLAFVAVREGIARRPNAQ